MEAGGIKCMNEIIIYGSCYGTAKIYAEALSEKTGIEAVPYDRISGLERYETIVYVGGLYAGGVRGMAKTVKKISADTCRRFLVITVGLADPKDEKNIRNIRDSAGKQIPEELRARTEFYHLRGGIDYRKLNLMHRTMMKLLFEQVKKQPAEQQDAETRAMIETYGKKVDFVDLKRLEPIAEMLKEGEGKSAPRFEIRIMKETEYPVLKDFLYEAIFVPEGEEAPERSILERPELQVYISDFGRNEGDCAVLASADGKIIGAAWARIMDDYGHIDAETPSLAIAVYKNYRGKGIGKKLLSLLLSCMQERDYKQVSLSVQKQNPAVRLYKKAGFITVKETDEEYIMVNNLIMSVNGKEYRIRQLLGRGKGGYSYLAESEGRQVVLKQIHHEPCDYYQFGNKLESEIRDYNRLREIGIPVPRMLDVDAEEERIVKEYIDGETVYEMVLWDRLPEKCLEQVKAMCGLLYPANTNIDYFPTNFILQDEKLYYVDYECNDYMEEWNFENWGMKYWSRTPEFLKYVKEHP